MGILASGEEAVCFPCVSLGLCLFDGDELDCCDMCSCFVDVIVLLFCGCSLFGTGAYGGWYRCVIVYRRRLPALCIAHSASSWFRFSVGKIYLLSCVSVILAGGEINAQDVFRSCERYRVNWGGGGSAAFCCRCAGCPICCALCSARQEITRNL